MSSWFLFTGSLHTGVNHFTLHVALRSQWRKIWTWRGVQTNVLLNTAVREQAQWPCTQRGHHVQVAGKLCQARAPKEEECCCVNTGPYCVLCKPTSPCPLEKSKQLVWGRELRHQQCDLRRTWTQKCFQRPRLVACAKETRARKSTHAGRGETSTCCKRTSCCTFRFCLVAVFAWTVRVM